ncbi:MAG: cobalamin-dependent protein [Deltaproteobacteria bacterium]|nr:cobalamin-dependent protein [Deltaproteobacteria bacterium]
MMKTRKRILIAKVGMDAHWRGAIIVAKALCDAGFEVVLGRNLTPAAVVATAVQEAVDYIGISSLSGNHLVTVPQIIELLAGQQAEDIKVIVGGIVPSADRQKLLDHGVLEVFGPGQDTGTIVEFLASH